MSGTDEAFRRVPVGEVAARNPFVFEWPVDQHGYEIEHSMGDGESLVGSVTVEFIRPAGGPPRYYRPLEERPDLWRQFAETCLSFEGALAFVREFGLLTDLWNGRDYPHEILKTAELIRQVATKLDGGDRREAADLLNFRPPRIEEVLDWNDRIGRFEIRLVPLDLRSALLHQAAEAITGNHQWRRCRNQGCPRWLQLGGPRGVTVRREFCSDKCRVASARRHKAKQEA
jgi:hypothetical protein